MNLKVLIVVIVVCAGMLYGTREFLIAHKKEHVWPYECIDYGIQNDIPTHWDGDFCVIEEKRDE